MLSSLFKIVEKANEKIEGDNILEISVKRSTISICLEGLGMISRRDFDILDNIFRGVHISKITSFQDVIYVHFDDLYESMMEASNIDEDFTTLYSLIFKLRDTLCTCPALEYVISSTYLKIYIDLPNIHVQDIQKVEEILQSQGVLELNNQRPYVLYVKGDD